MDIKTGREDLEKTEFGNSPNQEQPTRRQEVAPHRATGAEALMTTAIDPTMLGKEQSVPRTGGAMDAAYLSSLESGMVIGPAEHQVRLLHDLSGDRQVWMVLPVASAERSRGLSDAFRAIKLFTYAASPSPREAVHEERSQRAGLLGSRNYLAKIRAYIEQASKLDHPHIGRLFGWRQGGDSWGFAEMEYIDHQHSQNLTNFLREQGQGGVSWTTVLQWLQPIADALDYAREEHYIAHQHLDADKIFLTDQGVVKLVGFGLVAEPREPASVLFGSDAGMQETVAAGDGSLDGIPAETAFRRDVFALALLVYQMLTGRSAYEVIGNEREPLKMQPPGLTDEAWRVLRRGLAYPSELCPTEAGNFLSILKGVQEPTKQTTGRRSALRWNWLAGAGLLLLAGLGGVYWLAGSNNQEPVGEQPAKDAFSVVRQKSEGTPETGMSALLQEAEREADVRAFESAKRVDTVVAYQLYLQRCPRCGYQEEADSAIKNLQKQEKVNKIKADFEILARSLEQENRVDRSDEALEQLKNLAALAPGDLFIAVGHRRVALAWVARARESVSKGDVNGAWQALRKASAIQPELPELQRLTTELKQAETNEQFKQNDAEAFAAARRVNTRKAYWAYLERCSSVCGYQTEAEAALVRLGPTNAVMRDRLNDGSQGPELVVLRPGGFEMGSPGSEKGRYNDERQHSARINTGFAIGKYEVMFFEYDRFASAVGRPLPNDQGWGRGRRPVINVSWQDAKDYTDWLSQQTGRRYRLPTETEWEYAARGGIAASRYWGNNPDEGCAYANAADLDGQKTFVGWTVMKCHDGFVYTAPAGSYRDNDYGLHDMLGNVLEWTCSRYTQDYQAPEQTCEGPADEVQFVVRGGSWNDEPRNTRSADRHRNRFDFRDYYLGFRVVRELP